MQVKIEELKKSFAAALAEATSAEALEALTRRFDVTGAHRLADVVAARGDDMRFAMFNDTTLDLLSEQASAAARHGDLARAQQLADTWHDARNAITETETYNLDRKQHALTMIERLNAAMRM
jgi:DNA polymerase-3 subunit delta'